MTDDPFEEKTGKVRKRLVRRKIKKRRVRLTRSASPKPAPPSKTEVPQKSEIPEAAPDDPKAPIFEGDFESDFDMEDPSEGVRQMVGQVVQAILPDLIKRAVTGGVEALAEKEEPNAADEEPLSDGAASFVSSQGGGVRGEMSRIVSAEIQRFLQTVNISGELQKILTAMTFEIRTEIRFKPNDDKGLRPSVKNKVRVKRSRGDE